MIAMRMQSLRTLPCHHRLNRQDMFLNRRTILLLLHLRIHWNNNIRFHRIRILRRYQCLMWYLWTARQRSYWWMIQSMSPFRDRYWYHSHSPNMSPPVSPRLLLRPLMWNRPSPLRQQRGFLHRGSRNPHGNLMHLPRRCMSDGGLPR